VAAVTVVKSVWPGHERRGRKKEGRREDRREERHKSRREPRPKTSLAACSVARERASVALFGESDHCVRLVNPLSDPGAEEARRSRGATRISGLASERGEIRAAHRASPLSSKAQI